MMHMGDINEYSGGCSVCRDTILCNLSTVGGCHDACGGYYEYCGGVQYQKGTQITKDSPLWYS